MHFINEGVPVYVKNGCGFYNEFFYLKDNGSGIIKSAKSTDIINNLYDLSFDDINNTKIESTNINIEFKNDGSLSTNVVNNLTFKFADGSK